MKFHKWIDLKSRNKEYENPQTKKVKNHKWRNWKTKNEGIEKPQMKKIQFLKSNNWKSTNEEIKIPQMKKWKIHNSVEIQYEGKVKWCSCETFEN